MWQCGPTAPSRRRSTPSYYDVLGVAPSSSEAQIRSAYRQRVLHAHPDKGGDGATFDTLQEAYATLSDPQRRAKYDRELRPPGSRSSSTLRVSLASLYRESRHRTRYQVEIGDSGFMRVADVVVPAGTLPGTSVPVPDPAATGGHAYVDVDVRGDGVFTVLPGTRDVCRAQVVSLEEALRAKPLATTLPTGEQVGWQVDDGPAGGPRAIGQGTWWRLLGCGLPEPDSGQGSEASGDLYVHVTVCFPARVPDLPRAAEPPSSALPRHARVLPATAPMCDDAPREWGDAEDAFRQRCQDCPVQ